MLNSLPAWTPQWREVCYEEVSTVYHVTCALELATDLLVDLATFFSPPVPYQPLYALTLPEASPRRGV